MTITAYLSTGLKSRGRIDSRDSQVLLQGIKDIASTYTSVSGLTMISPDNTTTIDAFFKAYPTSSMGLNHWLGSCSMGSSASNSVVDQNTKVWNTNNLFVIDASIMPGMPMGNPHGAIMAAAEQGVARMLALAGGP
ncbi:hypothetical protein NP233_g6489 [Leucocoprinus birnbaumii]|uniref:Glucose-methanol-choline oxidoreductase C-terminal domain-containing protein n=1 Tax=Leucocoprinus birnbaumii TaxID=56174 RepID=A0AAD5YPZ2_9AGAR|nr:hypothetical protein NP233_g6489 [Leucocoprinus birnbaumii]